MTDLQYAESFLNSRICEDGLSIDIFFSPVNRFAPWTLVAEQQGKPDKRFTRNDQQMQALVLDWLRTAHPTVAADLRLLKRITQALKVIVSGGA